jgi:hypothetical protein
MSEFDAFAECFATPHLLVEFGAEGAVVCSPPKGGEALTFAAVVGQVAEDREALDLGQLEEEQLHETLIVDLHGDASMIRREWLVTVAGHGEGAWGIDRIVRGTLTRLELRRKTATARQQANRLRGGVR